MSFSGSYQPPGIYITPQSPPVLASPVTAPTTVALVGPTRGYFTNTDVTVLPVSPTTYTLSKNGISTASVVVTDAYGNVISATGNYTVAQTGTGTATVTTITATSGGFFAPATGAPPTAYISYQYTDANYGLPNLLSNYNQVQQAYGTPFDSNNNLVSPITLAAQFLYANGSPNVLVVPTADTNLVATQANIAAAYTLLESRNDVSIVVPLPTGITVPATIQGVGTDLRSHCDSMSQQSQWRIGILGYESSVTTTALNPGQLPSTGLAPGIGDERVIVAFPNALGYYYQPTNTMMTISGYYLAAAFAGFLASNPVQQGLTRQTILGFSGIPASILSTLSKANKNTWSAAGVSVVEPATVNGSPLVCRQGVTTSTTSTVSREISLVRAADFMMYDLYNTLMNSKLIGAPTTANTPAQVQGMVQGVLDYCVSQGVIIGYTALQAVVTSTNPTVITVTFAYQPAYPLNYISISFSVNTSTGTISTGSNLPLA